MSRKLGFKCTPEQIERMRIGHMDTKSFIHRTPLSMWRTSADTDWIDIFKLRNGSTVLDFGFRHGMGNMVKRFCIVLFCLHASIAWSAPSISNVTGTFTNGQTITISGSGFGNTGPNIVIYDQFEGTNGGNRSATATIGTWSYITKPFLMTYSSSYRKSGNTSLKITCNTAPDWIGPSAAVTFSGANKIFHSHWTYHPVNFLPRAWKTLWITAAWPDFNNSDWCINSNSGGFPASDWLAFRNDDNVRSVEYSYTSLTQSKWTRIDVFIIGAVSTGHFYGYETSSSGHINNFDFSGTTLRSGSLWNAASFPGYVDHDDTGYYHVDDVYIATGDGAACRVEIGNSATYADCTNLSICTVTSWSNTSIQATLRQSDFTNGTAYLFVIDADNIPSSGYQITLGESSATLPTVGKAITGAGVYLH